MTPKFLAFFAVFGNRMSEFMELLFVPSWRVLACVILGSIILAEVL